MITLIEALNFRSLRYIKQPLGSFHILVGPNASGKTSFLDVISFLSQLVSDGLESAIRDRGSNFKDLIWKGKGRRFELAIEAKIPQEIVKQLYDKGHEYDLIRYEVAIGTETDPDTTEILEERVLLKVSESIEPVQRDLFPTIPEMASTLSSKGAKNTLTIVNNAQGGSGYFKTELYNWTFDNFNKPCLRNKTRKHLNNTINEPEFLK